MGASSHVYLKKYLLTLLIGSLILILFSGCVTQEVRSEFCELPTKTGIQDDLSYAQSMLAFKRVTIEKQDGNRDYCIHVPSSYKIGEKIPVVFDFHGGGGQWFSAVASSESDKYSEEMNFIVVSANAGENKRWNVGEREMGERNSSFDDVGFVKKVIEDINSKYSIDERKIFAQGLSNGGMMSHHVACVLSDVFTGIAAIDTALMDLNHYGNQTCEPKKQLPVIVFHGTKDRLIPINGGESDPTLPPGVTAGENFLPAQASVDFWVQNNNCDNNTKIVYQNGEVTCNEYQNCADKATVQYCVIQNGGHVWPGGKYGYGPSLGTKIISNLFKETSGHITQDINGTVYAWNFLLENSD